MTFTKIGHANSTHVHFTFALNHNLNWVTSFMNTPISFKRFPCTFFIHQQTSLKLTKMHLFFSAFAFFIFLVGTRLGAHFIIMILIIQYKPRMNLVNKFEHYLKHQPLFKQSDLDSMFHTMFWLAAYIRSHFKSQLGKVMIIIISHPSHDLKCGLLEPKADALTIELHRPRVCVVTTFFANFEYPNHYTGK